MLKRIPLCNNCQIVLYNGSIYTVLRYSEWWWLIGPVFRESSRVQRGNGIEYFFRGLFRFVKPLLYSVAKAVGKEALKTGSNIMMDRLNKKPEEPVGENFKTLSGEAKDSLEQKLRK
jgi:hypothetical protein